MQFSLTGKVVLTLNHEIGESISTHEKTDFNLDVSSNISREQYLDKDDMPTKDGSKALTNTLAHGIIGNIHYAQTKGWMDSEAHMELLFDIIRKGVAAKANVGPSLFPDEDVDFMQRILPKHYVCTPVDKGVHCISERGISEQNNDEAWNTMVMEPIRKHFGSRFVEVFHQVCTNHSEFTVYLHKK